MIWELANYFYETNKIPKMWCSDDPFYDMPEPQLIGMGYYKLEPLAYLMDNPYELQIVTPKDDTMVNNGKLEVNIIPTDESGWNDPSENIIPD